MTVTAVSSRSDCYDGLEKHYWSSDGSVMIPAAGTEMSYIMGKLIEILFPNYKMFLWICFLFKFGIC